MVTNRRNGRREERCRSTPSASRLIGHDQTGREMQKPALCFPLAVRSRVSLPACSMGFLSYSLAQRWRLTTQAQLRISFAPLEFSHLDSMGDWTPEHDSLTRLIRKPGRSGP